MIFEIPANHKTYQTKEYVGHEIFPVLRDLMEFYDSLSFNVTRFRHPGVQPRCPELAFYIRTNNEMLFD